MADPWLAKYQNAIQICTEIAESINDLNNEQHFGSTSSVANVNDHIKKDILLITSLNEQLKVELYNPTRLNQKTQGELERRQNLLDNLSSKIQIVNSTFTYGRKFRINERKELLESTSSATNIQASNNWLENDEINSLQLSMKEQIYKEQEKGLDLLAGSLNRQKEIGINIGLQANEHCDILDEINSKTEVNHNMLNENLLQVATVHTTKSTFGLQIVVVLLGVVLIVVAFIPV